MSDPVAAVPVLRVGGAAAGPGDDALAVEAPLEIRAGYGPPERRTRLTVAVTLRTPGHDFDLALGYLFTEGVIAGPDDVLGVEVEPDAVRVELQPWASFDAERLERRGMVSSACGACGKLSAAAIARDVGPVPAGPTIPADVMHALPERLLAAQPAFARTGGLHAAGLFTAAGDLVQAREDVGRHNAVDKVLGAALGRPVPPVLFVSGRAGFELIQKAAAAGVSIFGAVGAPTTAAVELAQRVGMTLAGFVRGGRFTVYAGAGRIATGERPA